MFKGNRYKKGNAVVPVLCTTMIASLVSFPTLKAEEVVESQITSSSLDYNKGRYIDYFNQYAQVGFNNNEIKILPSDFIQGEGVEAHKDYEGKEALLTDEQSTVTWEVDVKKDGLYAVSIEHYPLVGYGSSVERKLLIDGKSPYKEAESISFTRIYTDEVKDPSGLTVRPNQVESPRWITSYVTDSNGCYGEAVYFYLEKGVHTLTLEAVKEPMAIANIKLVSTEVTAESYETVLNKSKASGADLVADVLDEGKIIIQAENSTEKSDPTLYAISDSSSTRNQPFSYKERLLNTIGGNSWKQPNQWITWTVDIPKSGYYNIGVRAKQNFVSGIYCNRTLYIDGQVPFEEASNIHFGYDDNWQVKTFGQDSEPWLFYLEEGAHTLTLKVTAGDLEGILAEADDILEDLSAINMELLALLSTSPDVDRDYQIARYMPNTVEALHENAVRIRAIYEEMIKKTGEKDSLTSQLEQLISLLDKMYQSPDKIASLYSRFRDLVGTFGEWITTVREQPLLLDYLFVSEPEAEVDDRDDGFIKKLWSGLVSSVYSFVNDYSMLSGSAQGDKVITVWIGSGLTGGRDQAMALNQMIQDSFTKETGIAVNLQLVPENTILMATLAGRGPDIALQTKMSNPVDFALRNAVYDLSQFEDFEEVKEQFFISATDPFEYDGGIYALPETMSFPMLFYRTDILEELGIDVEQLKTWDSIAEILPILQGKNMNFALPATMPSYSMFLYQMGGEYYTEDSMASNLDSKIALDAFETWTDFYSVYSLPIDFSFENRFRTGEMPIGIAEYTTYNLLSISAPEIKGKWAMIELPGFEQPDGTVNNISPITVQGCMMMNACEDKESAWEFMKWWTSADSQYNFGKQLESVMGAAARYNTANIEALQQMPWAAVDRIGLMTQAENIKGIPQIPGGYFTERNLNFAKLAVINNGDNPRESLSDYSDSITEEITLKRKEFGLNYIE